MALTSKEALIAAAGQSQRIETVDVPELGDSVCIRVLSGTERDAYEASIDDGRRRNLANFRARLVVMGLCDDRGERLFKDGEAAEVGRLLGAPATVRIFDAIRRLNGMSEADVQELAGNSAPGPSDASGSS